MEKITIEAYKSGKKIFLSQEECAAYEQRLRDHVLRKDLINFLLREGFKSSIDNNIFIKKDAYFTTYEFRFLSNRVYLTTYHGDEQWQLKKEHSIILKLCSIDVFKAFYEHMLAVEMWKDQA